MEGESEALRELIQKLQAEIKQYKELLDPINGWIFEDYHYLIQKDTLEELSKDEEIKSREGKFLIRLYPKGTAFDNPKEDGKELVEVKMKVWE